MEYVVILVVAALGVAFGVAMYFVGRSFRRRELAEIEELHRVEIEKMSKQLTRVQEEKIKILQDGVDKQLRGLQSKADRGNLSSRDVQDIRRELEALQANEETLQFLPIPDLILPGAESDIRKPAGGSAIDVDFVEVPESD